MTSHPTYDEVLGGNRAIAVTRNTKTNPDPHVIPLLRLFAGIQIIIGVTCIVASFVSISKHITTGYFVLMLSPWFVLTGIFPCRMAERYRQAWRCLKITFIIFSILSAIFVSPILIIIEAFYITLSRDGEIQQTVVILSAIVEIVVAIISASVGCCCSPLDGIKIYTADRTSTTQVPIFGRGQEINHGYRNCK